MLRCCHYAFSEHDPADLRKLGKTAHPVPKTYPTLVKHGLGPNGFGARVVRALIESRAAIRTGLNENCSAGFAPLYEETC